MKTTNLIKLTAQDGCYIATKDRKQVFTTITTDEAHANDFEEISKEEGDAILAAKRSNREKMQAFKRSLQTGAATGEKQKSQTIPVI